MHTIAQLTSIAEFLSKQRLTN